MPRTFDKAYYQRHYEDPATAVADPESVAQLGRFVCSYLDYLGVDIEVVLDMGCGVGLWQNVIERELPDARYVGVEYSSYVCERYGWRQGSVVDFDHPPVDFVICQGVLQYLNDQEAEEAIYNLSTLTLSALYLEALTKGDWEHVVDQRVTDGDVYLRSVEWYRQRLARYFINAGGSVFIKRDAEIPFFELEHL